MTHKDDRQESQQPLEQALLTVFVHTPGMEPKIARVRPDETVARVFELVGIEVGPEAVIVIGEPRTSLEEESDDEHDHVPLDVTIGKFAHKGHVHVHHHPCRQITTSVHYEAATISRRFSPARTVAQVRAWAIRKLHLDSASADNLVLEIGGSDVRPRPDERLATLATGPGCTLIFDLVPVKAVQG